MSKLSAVVKPEVYISWIPTGKVAVKPEIYISWIPTGKIGLKPQIYATYIPSPEKVSADSLRKVTASESSSADSLREVSKSENFSVDTLRQATRAENVDADTKRKVTADEIISADSLRRVVQVDSVTADTYREVKKTDSVVGDVRRQVTVSENISADTYLKIVRDEIVPADIFREVKKTEKIIADTSRKNGLTSISGDTDRTVKRYTDITADTWRKIAGEENISGNTSRRVVQSAEIQADISRTIQRTENCIADTKRAVTVADKFFADAYRQTVRTDIAKADTFRKVTTSISNSVDTVRKVGVLETISADTKRTFANKEQAVADTLLQTAATEEVTADLLRGLREVAETDTFRQVVRKEKTIARTVIRVPYVLNYVLKNNLQLLNKPRLRNTSDVSLVNNFKEYGVTAVDITLSEKTLSDKFSFSTSRPLEIEDTVQGWLLDYPFHFLVEETDQTELIQTVEGRYSKDDLLYKWFRFSAKNTEESAGTPVYGTATEIMQDCAQYLGMTLDIKIDDFSPSNLDSDSKITYADLLSTLFSWTSRLPQRQINVFIRDDVLHVIQRGKEDAVFDISDLPHSRPNINKKLNRVLCYNPNKNDNDDDTGTDDQQIPFSGIIYFSTSSVYIAYTYKSGLLTKEEISTRAAATEDSQKSEHQTTTTYTYTTFNSASYVYSKQSRTIAKEYDDDGSANVTETNSTTNYNYKYVGNNEIYLFLEYEKTEKREYNQQSGTSRATSADDIADTEIKETHHVPVGNGWYAQTVYVNGVFQGANLSQGKPGNSVSPYTVNRFQSTFHYTVQESIGNNDGDDDDELSLIVDDSFPVREADVKNALNEALRWLHRKIIKTVTVDLIAKIIDGVPEINHIVDFTERVKLDGEEYFLVSNKIAFTPFKLIQKLQLIRWY